VEYSQNSESDLGNFSRFAKISLLTINTEMRKITKKSANSQPSFYATTSL